MQLQTEKPDQTKDSDSRKKETGGMFSFQDTRPQALQLQQMQQAANTKAQAIQLKKDAALAKIRDKTPGSSTPTKVIKTKGGEVGVFRFPQGSGNIIDTFINKNEASDDDVQKAKTTVDSNAKKMEIPVKVEDHDLTKASGATKELSDSVIEGNDRTPHFTHADTINGTAGDRASNTWHHKASRGKMEMIDMNVHGAMWHYGGIASWGASKHTSDSDDDPTNDE